jgi:hypothetical protein
MLKIIFFFFIILIIHFNSLKNLGDGGVMTVYFATSYNLTDFNFINNSCPYKDDGKF